MSAASTASPSASSVDLPTADLPTAVLADPAAVDEALRAVVVDTTAPTPGLDAYLGDWMQALSAVIEGLLMRFLPGVADLTEGLAALLDPRLLWGFVVLLSTFLLVRALLRRRAREPVGTDVVEQSDRPETPRVPPSSQSAARWHERLQASLRAGDAGGALEALWWWLALRLDPNAESSWTSGELVRRTGRRDLRPSIRVLDRLRFGTAKPSTDEVARLHERLRGAVG